MHKEWVFFHCESRTAYIYESRTPHIYESRIQHLNKICMNKEEWKFVLFYSYQNPFFFIWATNSLYKGVTNSIHHQDKRKMGIQSSLIISKAILSHELHICMSHELHIYIWVTNSTHQQDMNKEGWVIILLLSWWCVEFVTHSRTSLEEWVSILLYLHQNPFFFQTSMSIHSSLFISKSILLYTSHELPI